MSKLEHYLCNDYAVKLIANVNHALVTNTGQVNSIVDEVVLMEDSGQIRRFNEDSVFSISM